MDATDRLDRPSADSRSEPHRPRSARDVFLRNFLRHPAAVGTLTRSSRAVVRRILSRIDFAHTETLVELGPGVGTITLPLLAHMKPGARLIAIETNAEFVDVLRAASDDPRLTVVHGSAASLSAILRGLKAGPVDTIVSGIPFSTLSPALRDLVLRSAHDALRVGGRLVVYQYTSRVVPHLERRFGRVDSGFELRSLVPMRIYRCVRGTAAR